MSVAAMWMIVGLTGFGLFLWNRRSVYADDVATRVLVQSQKGVACGPASTNKKNAADPSRIRSWIIGCIVLTIVCFVFQGRVGERALVFSALGAALGELYHRGGKERAQKLLVKRLEFFLPTAMERVVMAVGAGLDIIPALAEAARGSADPVSDVFRKIVALSESGLRVEQAIALVGDEVPSSAVKHALVHLGLAYKRGGEVVRPLKELSDATQTQYQETVEEEIAKLPVKAVVPLVLTFTGLIVCFLTVPIMQVRTSLEKFADVAK